MPMSLSEAPKDKLAYFRRSIPHCQVHRLVLWETVNPNSKNAHPYRIHLPIDQHTPLTPEAHQQFLNLMQLKPCETLPVKPPYFAILPCPGLHSTWSVNTIESLARCGLTGIRHIETGWVVSLPLGSDHHQLERAVQAFQSPDEWVVYTDESQWRHYFSHRNYTGLYTVNLLTDSEQALDTFCQRFHYPLNETHRKTLIELAHSQQRNLTASEIASLAKIKQIPACLHSASQSNTTLRLLPTSSNRLCHAIEQPHHPVLYSQLETLSSPHKIQSTLALSRRHKALMSGGLSARPTGSLLGIYLSDLHINSLPKPWETDRARTTGCPPAYQALQAIQSGAATVTNGYGAPLIGGFIRSHEQSDYHYDHPVIFTASLGTHQVTHPNTAIKADSMLVIIGEPAQAIGLTQVNSTQRPLRRYSPMRQRQCQQVLERAAALQPNPLRAMLPVGQGGLAAAIPTWLHQHQLGADCDLDSIPTLDESMSPFDHWCNETESRFLLAIDPSQWSEVADLLHQVNCPYGVLGRTQSHGRLTVTFAKQKEKLIDLAVAELHAKAHPLVSQATQQPTQTQEAIVWPEKIDYSALASRLLQTPSVADKTLLLKGMDRSQGGLVAREPCVGPWQLAVADCSITAKDFTGKQGMAVALGERASMAAIDPTTATTLALVEALTNLASSGPLTLAAVQGHVHWYGEPSQLQQTALTEYADALGLTLHQQVTQANQPFAPHPVISLTHPTQAIREHLTPNLKPSRHSSLLWLGLAPRQHMGGSMAAKVMGYAGGIAPGVPDPATLQASLNWLNQCQARQAILAYHDCSDGGLFTTLAEMAFAGRQGFSVELSQIAENPLLALFQESPGMVLQVNTQDVSWCLKQASNLPLTIHCLGTVSSHPNLDFLWQKKSVLAGPLAGWQRIWSQTSEALVQQTLPHYRTHPITPYQNHEGLHQASATFDIEKRKRPAKTDAVITVGILEEQGTYGVQEMAYAFHQAGFRCLQISMSDLIEKRATLKQCAGIAFCSGMTFEEAPFPAQGWANEILHHPTLHEEFAAFFARPDTFTLGIQHGAHVLTHLRTLIPGSDHWPTYQPNPSGRFESHWVLTRIEANHSPLLEGMVGSTIPVILSTRYGHLTQTADLKPCLRLVDGAGNQPTSYPACPTDNHQLGVTSKDGRVLLLQPMIARCAQGFQQHWDTHFYKTWSPWQKVFDNAYAFALKQAEALDPEIGHV